MILLLSLIGLQTSGYEKTKWIPLISLLNEDNASTTITKRIYINLAKQDMDDLILKWTEAIDGQLF